MFIRIHVDFDGWQCDSLIYDMDIPEPLRSVECKKQKKKRKGETPIYPFGWKYLFGMDNEWTLIGRFYASFPSCKLLLNGSTVQTQINQKSFNFSSYCSPSTFFQQIRRPKDFLGWGDGKY